MFSKSECWGNKPDAIEVTATCVFVRKGFEEIEQIEDGVPTGVMGWSYDEAKMSHGEYAAYANGQMEIELLDVQEAIAEMYEAIIGE